MWRASKQAISLPQAEVRRHVRGSTRWLPFLLLISILTIFFSAPAQAQGDSKARNGGASHEALNGGVRDETPPNDVATIYVLTFTGPITPVLDAYLSKVISEAQSTGAAVIILQLDTPGGSIEVMSSVVQRMLASPIPLVVYVAPDGARAGSAGTFITLAAHIAAMAPATSIGAASPVGEGGAEIEPTLAAKINNILSADIENLARRRGDAATQWAIAAVQNAKAATAQQALDLGVIDLIATDLNDLLTQLEGRQISLPGGATVLHLQNARIIRQDMSFLERLLNLLVDPTLATILLSLGILGIIVEIRTPGINFAGILGAICLLLAFYGLGQLDANLTGILFMAIALALFVAEAFTPAFGFLMVGGIIAFLLGGAMLFDTPGVDVPWFTLGLLAILLGAFTILVSYLGLRAQRRPAWTGTEGLIGEVGVTKTSLRAGETGSVFVHGEWWNARITVGEVAANVPVRVLSRRQMTLIVAPLLDPISGEQSTTVPPATPTAEK